MRHKIIKAVVCGAGRMGLNYLRILNERKDCKIVAVVDTIGSVAKINAEKYKCLGSSSLARAVIKTRPDCIFVTASTRMHFKLARECLRMGTPLLIEKPLAATLLEAEELLAVSKSLKIPLMVGHVERFNPASVCAKTLIDSGRLGEIVHISTMRVGGTPQDAARAGDVLVDLAVHDVDLVQWFLGATAELIASAGHRSEVLDSATLLMKLGPTTIDIHVNWLTPVKIREVRITGTQAYLHANLITQQVTLSPQNQSLSGLRKNDPLNYDQYLEAFGGQQQTHCLVPFQEPLKREIEAFLECLRSGKPMPVSALEGLQAMRAVEQARLELEGPESIDCKQRASGE